MTPCERKIRVCGEIIKQIGLQALSFLIFSLAFRNVFKLCMSHSISPLMGAICTTGCFFLHAVLGLMSLYSMSAENINCAFDYSRYPEIGLHPDLFSL